MLGQNRELERLLALPSPAFLSSSRSGDRGREVTGVTDHPISVGLKPMGTRGPRGSEESSKLCRCAVLVPSPSRGHESLMGLWGYVGTCQG